MVEFAANRQAFELCAGQRLLQQEPQLSKSDNASRDAAVLIPVIADQHGLTVLLTKRSDELPTHAGQIAFPGGKIDAHDVSSVAAALRETHEETGIRAEFVKPVGFLDSFETGTGFHVVPVIGLLSRGFELVREPGEVTDIFEVPLAFLMNPDNHQRKKAMWKGKMREYHAMPYEDRYIWGATAGMLVDLYERMSGNG